MSRSHYLANKTLDHELGGPDYERPATLYLALFTANPNLDGTGSEVSTGTWTNYERLPITNNSTNFPAASARVKLSGTNQPFTEEAETTGNVTVSHVALYDAATSGNMLHRGVIVDGAGEPAPKIVQNGDAVEFPAGSLKFEEL